MRDSVFGIDVFDGTTVSRSRQRKAPAGCVLFDVPKPRSHYNHYSNPASQGALICETLGFPEWFRKDSEQVSSAYSDRIAGWDYARFERACKIAEHGDQGWAQYLPRLSSEKLKEFAAVALDIEDKTVLHVRAVHYFNVSTGYSCPLIIAIYMDASTT